MATTTILVGTVGQGISVPMRGDLAACGDRPGDASDAMVRTLLNHPHRPEIVFAAPRRDYIAATTRGNAGPIDSPLSKYAVWALAIDPVVTEVMFAGTGHPPRRQFSDPPMAAFTGRNARRGSPTSARMWGSLASRALRSIRWTASRFWVGIEVDGARHSTDGGETWTAINGAIPNPDVHNVAVAGGPPKTVFIVVNNEVYTSTDEGGSWNPPHVKEVFPWTYPRGIAVQPGHAKTGFVTIGDTTPGRTGTVMRSKDAGKTWENLRVRSSPIRLCGSCTCNRSTRTLSLPAVAMAICIVVMTAGIAGGSWRGNLAKSPACCGCHANHA